MQVAPAGDLLATALNDLEDKFATDSDCANAARGYTDSKEEFLDCIEFRGMGRFSMGGLQLRHPFMDDSLPKTRCKRVLRLQRIEESGRSIKTVSLSSFIKIIDL